MCCSGGHLPSVITFPQNTVVSLFLLQQKLLATYLIPGCVGRGVNLGSISSSVTAVAVGIGTSGIKNQNEDPSCPKCLQGPERVLIRWQKILTLVGFIVDGFFHEPKNEKNNKCLLIFLCGPKGSPCCYARLVAK